MSIFTFLGETFSAVYTKTNFCCFVSVLFFAVFCCFVIFCFGFSLCSSFAWSCFPNLYHLTYVVLVNLALCNYVGTVPGFPFFFLPVLPHFLHSPYFLDTHIQGA